MKITQDLTEKLIKNVKNLKTNIFIFLGVGNPSPQYVSKPYFGDETEGVVVQQGEVAFFNCHVHNLANQTVSHMIRF